MARGTAWLLMSRITTQSASVTSLAITARFLSPGDFGLMAVVMLLLTGLESFTTPGLAEALIRHRGDVPDFFPSVFAVNVLRGAALATATAVLGPSVASFFSQPQAAPVVQCAGAIFMIRSLQSPAQVHIDRQLEYKRLLLPNLAAAILFLLSSAILALALHNVWSLLIATILGEICRTAGSYIAAPWRPRLAMQLADLAMLTRFGKWVVAGSSLVYLSLHLDNIIVGRLFGASALGYYEMAFRIAHVPTTQISQIVGTVAFPALSRLTSTPDQFAHVYLRIIARLWMVNILVAALPTLIAGPIVRWFLGPQWDEIMTPLRILAMAGLIRSLVTVGGRVFFALGHPEYDFVINLSRVVIFALAVYPMAERFALAGVAIAVLVANASTVPLYLALIQKTTGLGGRAHASGLCREWGHFAARVRSVA